MIPQEEKKPSKFRLWLKRIGWVGFLFFLIKGLIWLFVLFILKKKLD